MYKVFFKPLSDRFFALLLLLLISPILIIVGLSILSTIGSPIFFRQKRPGKDGTIFNIFKFRTMSNEKDSTGKLLPDEERLKGFGKTIRSLSLDELPQLINVLKGEMSFIGPRPLLVEYLPLYSEQQKKRHDVLPGISGWAQINGRNTITWEEKFELDCFYVDNISFKMDMKIVLMTIQKVLKRDGVSSGSSVTMEKFRGSK
jgi:lipopolysaccharide/colanic/teichoic acid biosynthesis glycosyltransferase